jgi:hypothetical protein
MTGKRLLIVSLLLPFMGASSVVHADPTATKKRHWANELRSYSFKKDRMAPSAQAAPQDYGPTAESCAYRYQGGPKSSLWTCRR